VAGEGLWPEVQANWGDHVCARGDGRRHDALVGGTDVDGNGEFAHWFVAASIGMCGDVWIDSVHAGADFSRCWQAG